MAHVACYTSESSHLLVNTASEDSSSLLQWKSVCISCPPSKHLCLPSKAAILILLWTIIVGATYHNLVGLSALLILSNPINSQCYLVRIWASTICHTGYSHDVLSSEWVHCWCMLWTTEGCYYQLNFLCSVLGFGFYGIHHVSNNPTSYRSCHNIFKRF